MTKLSIEVVGEDDAKALRVIRKLYGMLEYDLVNPYRNILSALSAKGYDVSMTFGSGSAKVERVETSKEEKGEPGP